MPQRMGSVTVQSGGALTGLRIAAVVTIICLGAVITIVVGREYASGRPADV